MVFARRASTNDSRYEQTSICLHDTGWYYSTTGSGTVPVRVPAVPPGTGTTTWYSLEYSSSVCVVGHDSFFQLS